MLIFVGISGKSLVLENVIKKTPEPDEFSNFVIL